jgi:hypothetical protein
MKRIMVVFSLTILLGMSVFAQSGSEWVSLFNGKSLSGWHLFKKPGAQTAWTVRDGAIYLDISQKEGRGDLVTDQSYKDFHLRFEWKVAKGSNSGIMFFVQENNHNVSTWHTGPEFQVIDNTGYPDKLEPRQKSASLYDLIACPESLIKPTGEWNQGEIIVKQGKITFIVNGKSALSVMHDSDEWKTLISASKFAAMNAFAKTTEGRIALQDHGGEVWYRDIRIKSL